MSIDISVIVPVYNAEKYLPQCVESLLQQTKKEFELIFVDDGSTDRSVEILEQYRATDDRIKILRQKNQYAGVARNNGMAAATGKYLMFLDADDFFKRNMLAELYRAAEKHQAEVVVCGHYVYDEERKKAIETVFPRSVAGHRVFCPKNYGENMFHFCLGVPWNKLLLRSFVLHFELQYQEIITTNDEYFNKIIMALAERVYIVKKGYIYYRVNNSSSLQGKRQNGKSLKSYNTTVLAAMKLKEELLRRNLFFGAIRQSYYLFAEGAICSSVRYAVSMESFSMLYDFLKNNMIPDLFESAEDMEADGQARRMYDCTSPMEFLLHETIDLRNNSIPCTSKTFLVGNAIITSLKAIRSWLRQFR